MASILKQYKVVCAPNKSSKLFESLFGDTSFLEIDYQTPSEYVNKYWAKYLEVRESSTLNGKMFELIMATLFIREGLLPLYLQARVAFVPNIEFDSLLYSHECGPVAFSLKTSLRERYKQADLEAIALKYVHRKAKSYLLTLEEHECSVVNEKIRNGEVIGLNRAILCSNEEIDKLIEELKAYDFCLAGNIDIIESNQIITQDLIR